MSGGMTAGGDTRGASVSTGGGGMRQSSDAFSGLTDTDLRPRKRRRRIPLLNTTWLFTHAGRRRKGADMRKEVTDLVGTLEQSVVEIAGSAVDDREERLRKSLGEFQAALLDTLAPMVPEPVAILEGDDPMTKSANVAQMFARVMGQAERDIEAMSKMASPDSAVVLDRFLQAAELTLADLANESAELPEPDDLERAEQAGELIKMATFNGGEVTVRSHLPENCREFITDPVTLVCLKMDLARAFSDDALALAAPLIEADALPDEVVQNYPDLFEPQGPLGKAAFTPDSGADDSLDPDSVPAGDAVDDGNPLIVAMQQAIRMQTGSMVILGSALDAYQQALEGGAVDGADPSGDGTEIDDGTDPGGDDGSTDGTDTTPVPGDSSGIPDDETLRAALAARRLKLQRQAPTGSLAKMLAGEVEVPEELAAALEELDSLRKRDGERDVREADMAKALARLTDTVERLQKQPAPPKGALFSVTKSEDGMGGHAGPNDADRIVALAKEDPEAGSKELVKLLHSGGGQPLIPPR